MNSAAYYVYILASHRGTIYTGMTRDIAVRIDQHKSGHGGRFSSKYRTGTLVYCEVAEDLDAARERERQIKNWNRQKKINLIEVENPYRRDISATVG